jgi:hypothetical protein
LVRACKPGSLKLRFFGPDDDNNPVEWNARIAEGFRMAVHSVYGEDFVLDLILENKGPQFPPVWSFDNGNNQLGS